MAYLAYVRHGLSQANIDKIVAGHFDSPLVDIGREQARTATTLLKDIPFHHVYGSPLLRAKETLEIILGELQLGVAPTFHDELKERNWGDVEGKKHKTQGGGLYTVEQEKSWLTWDGKPNGGESYGDMSNRIVPFFQEHILPKLKAGQNVLVISHNGVSKPLQQYLEGIPKDKTHILNLQNCEIKLYEFDQNGILQKVESRLPQNP